MDELTELRARTAELEVRVAALEALLVRALMELTLNDPDGPTARAALSTLESQAPVIRPQEIDEDRVEAHMQVMLRSVVLDRHIQKATQNGDA